MLPGSAGPTVLTEPYSLPRLLMATKNRLATPKMLTTPRSTGDSSSRPGGGARVIPGHRTLGPSFPPGPLLPPPGPPRLGVEMNLNGPAPAAVQAAPHGPQEPRGLGPCPGRAQSGTTGAGWAPAAP